MPSTVIKRFSYDENSKILTIVFLTEMVYQYLDVPKRIFEMFKAANSKGRYFNRYVKDKFNFEKLEEV